MTNPLYIVRLVLNRRAVLRVGARHRLGQAVDDGALLHAGLSQLFARSTDRVKLPLHTFVIDDLCAASLRQPNLLFLLAYAGIGERELTAAMGPERAELVHRCEAREMPVFEAGQHLGFRIQACPITRTRVPGSRALRTDRQGRVKSRELDAFVHATLGVPKDTPVNREDVYRRWLQSQVERRRACALGEVGLTEFRRETMRRRGNARLERPNAVLEGTLCVGDPAEFHRLLTRGVGRHRAFGFGMLLLRPAVR